MRMCKATAKVPLWLDPRAALCEEKVPPPLDDPYRMAQTPLSCVRSVQLDAGRAGGSARALPLASFSFLCVTRASVWSFPQVEGRKWDEACSCTRTRSGNTPLADGSRVSGYANVNCRNTQAVSLDLNFRGLRLGFVYINDNSVLEEIKGDWTDLYVQHALYVVSSDTRPLSIDNATAG